MAAVTVLNETNYPALMFLERGAGDGAVGLRASFAVAPMARTTMSPAGDYVVTAAVTMEDGITYTTSPTTLSSGNAFDLLAQVRVAGGLFSFEIAVEPGVTPDLITLSNSCRQSVTFTLALQEPGPGARPMLERRLLIAQNEEAKVGLSGSYRILAVVDGITTEAIQTGEDVSVTVYRDPADVGNWPAYALRQSSGAAQPTAALDQATEAPEGD